MRKALLLLLAATGCPADSPPPPVEAPPLPPAEAYPDPGEAGLVLTAAARARWSVREVGGLPEYFQPAGWGPGDSIWGIARSVPLLTDGMDGGVRELRGTAWGAVPSPDWRRLAWTDERGLWLGGVAREPSILLHAGDAHPGGEGGPPTELLWSPAGDRILAGWVLEWDAVHSVVTVPAGGSRNIHTSIDGYFLRDARLWLDDERVLFATRAVRSHTGAQEYGPGYRADLAILDLRAQDYRTVTAVADGVFLDPAGRVPDGVLVTELDADGRVLRHWLYDPSTWEPRPYEAPAGRLYTDATTGNVLVMVDLGVDRVEEGGGYYGLDVVLDGVSTRLGAVRGDVVRAFWGGEGRLLIAADGRVFVVEGGR